MLLEILKNPKNVKNTKSNQTLMKTNQKPLFAPKCNSTSNCSSFLFKIGIVILLISNTLYGKGTNNGYPADKKALYPVSVNFLINPDDENDFTITSKREKIIDFHENYTEGIVRCMNIGFYPTLGYSYVSNFMNGFNPFAHKCFMCYLLKYDQ